MDTNKTNSSLLSASQLPTSKPLPPHPPLSVFTEAPPKERKRRGSLVVLECLPNTSELQGVPTSSHFRAAERILTQPCDPGGAGACAHFTEEIEAGETLALCYWPEASSGLAPAYTEGLRRAGPGAVGKWGVPARGGGFLNSLSLSLNPSIPDQPTS